MWEMSRSKILHHPAILPMFRHHTPSLNPNLPHTLTWVGHFPHPKCLMMRLSSNLLQISRWMLPAYGGYTAMQSDIHRMAGRIDSIKQGVSYFHGYVDRQEAREERRMHREEERGYERGPGV